MKNIYNDKDMSSQQTNPAGAPEVQATPSPEQPLFQQPVYGQPVYYVPVGQVPYGQTGYPIQQIPLTQEQLNMIFQQYGAPPQYIPPQPQPFQPAQQAPQNDSGMRVLYQSEDFDKPAVADEGYDEEAEELPTEETPLQSAPKDTAPQKPIPVKPSMTDDIEIEEETISLPHKSAPPKKSSFTVEEMEMSTYELNSILLRQGKGATTYQRPAPERSRDVPLNFGGGFEIEDMADEVVTDVSSSTEEKPEEKKKKKKLSRFEIIRRTVLGVAIAAIVISSAMLINEYRLSSENNKLEEGISDLIITEPSAETTEESGKDDKETTKKKDKDKDKTTTAALTPEQQWAEIQKEYPNVIFPMGLQLKYAKLYATNQDFVGYLEAKGINLSLPIVQAENDKKYLEKNFYGKSTKYGCPFVTHVNNIVELDQNTIIFGHHMNNGTVFGALDAYKSIDGFRDAPVITFNTLYKDYSWKVVAAFVTNAYEEDDNGYLFRYYFASLSTQDRFAAYLNEMSQRSLYDTGVDVLPTDKLLTLSTCSHEFDDARFVVVARLVRPGESTDVDVSKATVNPNPRYPQAYYDKKKLDNPYANASRWEVG